MTYGKLKQKILSLLDLKTESGVVSGSVYDDVIASMAGAVDSAARKIASTLKNVIKQSSLTFDGTDTVKASAPSGFIALKSVVIDGKSYAPSLFFVSGGYIVGDGVPSGTADVYYYSYPSSVENMTDASNTDFDGVFFDLVALGAAIELSSLAYPGDFERYSTLSTEYDGKMACAFISGGDCTLVGNSLYGKRTLL